MRTERDTMHNRRLLRGVLFGVPLAVCMLLSACRTAWVGSAADSSPEPASTPDWPMVSVPKAETLDEAPLIVQDVLSAAKAQARTADETTDVAELLRREAPDVGDTIGGPPSENLLHGIADPEKTVKVVLNFVATPLNEVVPLFAELLGFSFIIDPSVKGAVTMTLDTEMTVREVWRMFEHILWLSGSYASRNPGFIHIMPFQKMPQERRLLTNHEPLANVAVEVLPVRYTKSAEILAQLKPFTTEGATVVDVPRLNALLVVESPINLEKLRELVRKLDVRGEAAWPHITLRAENIDVETLQEELTAILPVLGFQLSSQTPSGGAIKVVSVPRLQALVVSAALQDVLDEIERWIRVLDRTDTAEETNIFFYNVQHSTAEHLGEVLQVFFGSMESHTRTRTADSTGGQSVSSRATPAGTSAAAARATTARRTAEQGEPETIFDTPMVVYADADQNRLTIRTTARAYAMVEALLRRLDVSPRQVVIQSIITEVTLSESTEYGFSYAAMQKFGDDFAKHAMINTPVGSDTVTGFPDPGNFSSGIALLLQNDETNPDRMAFIRAVAGENNVRVLSAPQITATNDQEATINIGDRVPVVTGDYTDVTGAGSGTIQRNIQYEDTGIIMTVTPHITAGNEVKLEVTQEVSDAVETESSDIDSPTIQTRELATTLVVPDGGTALLGGLIRTQRSDGRDGVPLLMNIPVLGNAFRSTKKESRRVELLVLITVNVTEGQSATDELLKRYQAALAEIEETMGL